MPVVALKEYNSTPRDDISHYDGKQLNYVSWDQHLLFAAPFLFCSSPELNFGEFVEGSLVPLMQADPDAENVDWSKAEWFKGNKPWSPDFERSLADNGIDHKDQLRFRTPGLNTVCG